MVEQTSENTSIVATKTTKDLEQKETVVINTGLSIDEFNKNVNSSIKLNIVNVLDRILGKHGASRIRDAQSYALVKLNSEYISRLYPEASKLDNLMLDLTEEYDYGVDKAKEVLEACKVEIQKDFEIQKAQAKVAMRR